MMETFTKFIYMLEIYKRVGKGLNDFAKMLEWCVILLNGNIITENSINIKGEKMEFIYLLP